ncbi:MAG: flagellar hook-basal body protein [Gemmatimonadota bacterium]
MKTDGIASAASAMRYWERRQEVAANNLANATTGGFKAERVFARLANNGVPVPEAETDWAEGSLAPTGNPLDVAVRGNAFLVVQTPEGERYSRGGAWSVDSDGFLTDSSGNRALGERGPVKIGGGKVEIDRTGRVIVDRIVIDRLRVETVPAGAVLTHEEGVRWIPPTERAVLPPELRDVRQGSIESSNVNSVESLVELISIQRNYAFAQKALSTIDQIRSTISNDLGKA